MKQSTFRKTVFDGIRFSSTPGARSTLHSCKVEMSLVRLRVRRVTVSRYGYGLCFRVDLISGHGIRICSPGRDSQGSGQGLAIELCGLGTDSVLESMVRAWTLYWNLWSRHGLCIGIYGPGMDSVLESMVRAGTLYWNLWSGQELCVGVYGPGMDTVSESNVRDGICYSICDPDSSLPGNESPDFALRLS